MVYKVRARIDGYKMRTLVRVKKAATGDVSAAAGQPKRLGLGTLENRRVPIARGDSERMVTQA